MSQRALLTLGVAGIVAAFLIGGVGMAASSSSFPMMG